MHSNCVCVCLMSAVVLSLFLLTGCDPLLVSSCLVWNSFGNANCPSQTCLIHFFDRPVLNSFCVSNSILQKLSQSSLSLHQACCDQSHVSYRTSVQICSCNAIKFGLRTCCLPFKVFHVSVNYARIPPNTICHLAIFLVNKKLKPTGCPIHYIECSCRF